MKGRTRVLVFMALMVALSTLLSVVAQVYVTPTQKLFTFAYLPRAMVAMFCGPWAALATAFTSDFTGYLANPQGAYFPGYAVSAMATDLLCALLLYRRGISWWRVALWRLLVVLLVTFGLNQLWMNIQFGGSAGTFFTRVRLIRNAVQFPLDVFLTVFLGRYMQKFIPKEWK